MPILSVKNDDSGQWKEIVALKGDPGKPGESGVYTGPTEPIDPAITVWIDNSSSSGSNLVLKVKDITTNSWTTIENLQGDIGPEGPIGPQGEKGENGVYVGEMEPQDESLIWINPEGIPTIFPDVLQTTGDSTTDTMSQKAITDALNNVQPGGSFIAQSNPPDNTNLLWIDTDDNTDGLPPAKGVKF